MAKKVRCISAPGLTALHLTVGNIYEAPVISRTSCFVVVKDNGSGYWFERSLFVEVDDERPTLPNLQAAARINDLNVDHEEERCRAVLLGPRKGHCACDLPIKDCWIHR